MPRALLAATVLLLHATAFAQTAAQPPLPTITLRVSGINIIAEVADNEQERQTGLMFRESLPDNHGMLFVMPSTGPVAFWMKNTKIPLSVAYIDPEGAIVEIHDLQPFDEKVVPSAFPRIAYALEMPQQWFTKKNIWPGERISGLPKLSSVP